MTIETSTANVVLGVLLGAICALQAWIIRELFKIRTKLSLIVAVCPKIKGNKEFDTDRITRDDIFDP